MLSATLLTINSARGHVLNVVALAVPDKAVVLIRHLIATIIGAVIAQADLPLVVVNRVDIQGHLKIALVEKTT